MDKLATPTVEIANYSAFDFATGRTEVVTLTVGGNRDLAAERRHVRSLGLNVKPLEHFDGHAIAVAQDAHEQMRGADALVPTISGLLGRQDDNPSCPARESLQHDDLRGPAIAHWPGRHGLYSPADRNARQERLGRQTDHHIRSPM